MTGRFRILGLAALAAAAAGCAARAGAPPAEARWASSELQFLAYRWMLAVRGDASRFVLLEEGRDPAAEVMGRLAASDDYDAVDAHTLALSATTFRPAARPGRVVTVDLSAPAVISPDEAQLTATHHAAGESPATCRLTLLRRTGAWSVARVRDPGCQPRPT